MADWLMCPLCPGKISYLVSGVPLFTICRMNDLRSEFNSRNSVYNASRFTAQVTGHNQKALSKARDVNFTRDSQEVYGCFHATNPN